MIIIYIGVGGCDRIRNVMIVAAAMLAMLLLGGCGSGTAIPEGLSESDIMQGKGAQAASEGNAATGAGTDGQGDSNAGVQGSAAGQGDSDAAGQENAAGGGAAADQGEASSGAQSVFAGAEPAAIADAATGAEQMSGHIRELKTALESDDVTRSRELAGMMASIWLAMEAEVRDSQPELHKSLHGDLTALLAGLQEEEWDKAGLVELDYALYQGFRDLRGKFEQ